MTDQLTPRAQTPASSTTASSHRPRRAAGSLCQKQLVGEGPLRQPCLPRRAPRAGEDSRVHLTAAGPLTGNPHLFINRYTAATTTAQVTNRWIDTLLGPHPTVSALRHDRLLDEARATGGDPKHLTVLFGLGLGSALRYTSTVTHPALNAVPPVPRGEC